jgi:hypothetical protein
MDGLSPLFSGGTIEERFNHSCFGSIVCPPTMLIEATNVYRVSRQHADDTDWQDAWQHSSSSCFGWHRSIDDSLGHTG